ncbi:SET domain-containing protein [Persicirhabdus sediminis]|uniref:SET domain-containing protein-lysine N-methyltransferase n=1 Tax=Persicirhabdus sediminis TaxID=454144 RepID=A0A8J7MCW8_9BACT|nr:SET domain-containing protein-lysine N-methyltransferase [Persicirhabdus sediminis]MBK1790175.1 SET domain-containing protein-lysine N-methyltransferase [Persicirhabdus sediminis]
MGKKQSKRDKLLAKEAKLVHKMRLHYLRGKSELCEVRNSEIHGRGVYATQDIEKESQIIEYIGEPIDKEESEERAWDQYAKAEEKGEAAVYIFTLDEKWDIDGNVPWNDARLINHSCDPNCEAWIEDEQIFIYSLRDIKDGEELTFDYGFDIDCYEDHPCLCGSDNCIGYIVSQDQWPELKKRIAESKGE